MGRKDRDLVIVLAGIALALCVTTAPAYGNPPCFCITIPSAEQEAAFVWKLLTNIRFYDRNHYALSMPRSEIVSMLLEKARKNELSSKDMSLLQKDFQTTVYNRMDYQNGYRPLLMSCLQQMQKLRSSKTTMTNGVSTYPRNMTSD